MRIAHENSLWLEYHYRELQLSIEEISALAGVSESTIQKKLKDFKIPRLKKGEQRENPAYAKLNEFSLRWMLEKRGMTPAEISQKIGCCEELVVRKIRLWIEGEK